MKRPIKQCKGFNENPCLVCKRKDENAELLVQSLSRNIENNKTYCIHFISKFRKI